jgi:quinol monooxygenase YgiN
MIVRLVKMVFQKDKLEDFKNIFQQSQPKIALMDGCLSVQLHQDVNHPQVFFTISEWQSEVHLENYRNSQLFISTWKKVKPMFTSKAEAWSLWNPNLSLD